MVWGYGVISREIETKKKKKVINLQNRK